MSTDLKPLTTYLSDLIRNCFPPLLLIIGSILLVQHNELIALTWFNKLSWLPYVSLGLTSLVAWQFGRSRLVLAAFCLLLLLVTSNGLVNFDASELEKLIAIIALWLCWLAYSKDKGFSPVNLVYSLGLMSLIAAIVWWLHPQVNSLAQPLLVQVQSLSYAWFPQLLAVYSPFELLVFFVLTMLSMTRFLWFNDRNHSALFFTLVLLTVSQNMQQVVAINLAVVGLCLFYLFAVLTDSFNMAYKDELTGIPSRRALMQFVQTLGRKYVVVMSDIDHFKKFNDSYGHDVGDQVLKLVASKLSQVTGGGKAFRYGGEEFILIFARKDVDEVLPHVEALRQSIADYPITIRSMPRPQKAPKKSSKHRPSGKTAKITTSFGVAKRSSEHNDFSSIMKQADIALYAAKKAGRNCVKQAKQA